MAGLTLLHSGVLSIAGFFLIICDLENVAANPTQTLTNKEADLKNLEELYWTENYKRKILNRLHLSRPPLFNSSMTKEQLLSRIPLYMRDEIERKNNPSAEENDEQSEHREIIIAAKPTLRCPLNVAAGCFVLDIVDDIPRHQLLKVTFNAESENPRIKGKTLSLWAAHHMDNGAVVLAGNDPIHQIVIPKDDTAIMPVVFDLSSTFSNWLRVRASSASHRKVSRTVVVRCDNCDFSDTSPIDNHKVIIEIHYMSKVRSRRSNLRIENECSGLSADCCTKNISVTFSLIKWDFIFFPLSIYPFYCRGKCVQDFSNEHADLLSIVTRLNTSKTNLTEVEKQEARPCCAGQKYASMTFMYLDERGKVVLKTLHNLIVTKCDCK